MVDSIKNTNKLFFPAMFVTILVFLVLLVSVVHAADDVVQKPPFWEKAETARWLAHENLWGTLSTTSVHLNGQAWGQPKSFVDGSNSNSTGNLYFYDSDMDTSMEVFFVRFHHVFKLAYLSFFLGH